MDSKYVVRTFQSIDLKKTMFKAKTQEKTKNPGRKNPKTHYPKTRVFG